VIEAVAYLILPGAFMQVPYRVCGWRRVRVWLVLAGLWHGGLLWCLA
jgi:hypothetical protein